MHFRGNKLCAVHVLTPNRPLVFGGSESLMFGPYHTHYPKLEEHMEEVGLGIQPNLWDKPLYMGMYLCLCENIYIARIRNLLRTLCTYLL